MKNRNIRILATAMLALLFSLAWNLSARTAAVGDAEDEVVKMLGENKPFHAVTPEVFNRLGWDLPDGGAAVKALADAAPGGAFDPRKLESISEAQLGYRVKWHEVRYKVYGIEWDIPGLMLTPLHPVSPNLPTMVIINGGSSNWYEFFVDPLNAPGLGQYLAQRVPTLIVTIPGNFRHGGWSEAKYEERIPGYVLDRDVSADELKFRNAAYTFRVVADGVAAIIEKVVQGPVVIVGHSTGGEIQFLLKDRLKSRLRGLSLGWGTGGPASLAAMQEFRGERGADDYLHVRELRARPNSGHARGYLGPLNPVWDASKSREAMAEHWMGLEERRRPKFKQPLQDMEHNSADNLRENAATQIRETLKGNKLGVNPDEVIRDLFSTMKSPEVGYTKMIWTTAQLDDGHWDKDSTKARELQVANEFRKANPGIPIRVMVFDVPMTHYGHVEKPKQLAGGLLAALMWLAQ
ncbi:MAG: alpha/beta hydrolase [Acidobacteria bacterium]|nr:alpha/beta hydrolase [Acidobacteriota bacterium]